MKAIDYLKVLSVLFCSQILLACDPFCTAEISNYSKQSVLVEIMYNKNNLKKKFQSYKTFEHYLNRLEFHPNKSDIREVDTVNYRVTFNLVPMQTVRIDGGKKIFPDFDIYDRMIVNSSKQYHGEEAIKNAFEDTGAGFYELKIK